MAKRILVPLDLDDGAQAVVSHVADVARGSGGIVRLLHVTPVPDVLRGPFGRVIAYVDQEMARLEAEGIDGLQAIQAQLSGIPAEIVVRFGETVEEILLETEAWGADLIALTTTNTGRVRRVLGRGVAERVFRAARTPVLLLRDGSTLSAA
jgi:nucleotide-binding universal stress UspA family protein